MAGARKAGDLRLERGGASVHDSGVARVVTSLAEHLSPRVNHHIWCSHARGGVAHSVLPVVMPSPVPRHSGILRITPSSERARVGPRRQPAARSKH